jgi:uncharacterized protein YacL
MTESSQEPEVLPAPDGAGRIESGSSPSFESILPSEHAVGTSPLAAERTRPRIFLVEVVRLVMVGLGTLGGWEIARHIYPDRSTPLLLGIILGSLVGYVVGGVFGRTTASAVSELEREFRRIPASEMLAGVLGLLVGLALAALLSIPLFQIPKAAAFPSVAFLYLLSGYVGFRIGRAKSDDLFGLFGVKPRAAGTQAGEVSVVDTSAILDGRLLSLVRMRFLHGTLLVTRGVLDELQRVADSSDAAKRSRGRRALDLLIALKRDPLVEVVLVEDVGTAFLPGEEVDSQLVKLAKDRGGALVTNDANLAKVAAALDVPVRSLHALADALRPQVVPGERIEVRLTRPGRTAGQAVGYLEDGTMVVVEEASDRVGDVATVSVTNALQTATGQMVFARLASDADPDA